MCSTFQPVRVTKGIYFLDLLALLAELTSNSAFNFITRHGSKKRTVLSLHLAHSSVTIHTWSSEVAILHAFFGCSLAVLLLLVTILRLAAIVRWKFLEGGHDLGERFDFLTTFGRGRQSLSWWKVLFGESILKTHLP